MKIKRLEIYGFKSFPYRVALPFPPGISAIVGPNGSGKSNIVDALRWVLGEQSLKRLRVKAAEDLLFAGDHGRAPGFAEVRLVLENDGGAPERFKDLPEIVVARRLYRTGESEFLLNNRACRLKDIQYLFLDTGVNPRGYGLIDQGEVGKFLEWSPQERRFFLEELAGVSRYRVNREETQRNLARTRENLSRVEDLLLEIENQVRHLEEQARLAEEFLRLREELKRLSLTRLAVLYLKAKREKERVEKSLNQLQEALARLESRETELAPLYEKALSKAGNLRRRKKEKEEALSSLEEDLRRVSEKLRGLYREEAEISKRLERERARSEALSEELSRLEAESQRLAAEVVQLEKELTREKENFQELEARHLAHRRALEEAERAFKEMESQILARKERLRVSEDQIQRLERELKRLSEREGLLFQKAAGISTRRASLLEEKEKISKELEGLEEALRDLSEKEKIALEEKERLRSQVRALEERLRELEAERRALTKEGAGLEAVLRQTLPANLRQLKAKTEEVKLLAEVLELAPEKIQLAEALLGEKLTYPVAESPEKLAELLRLAEVKGLFLAGEAHFEALMALLEGVDRGEDPQRLWEEPSSAPIFFEEEGLIFEPPGFLFKVAARSTGLLGLRERLKEIEKRLAELEAESRRMIEEKARLSEALSDPEKRLKRYRREREEKERLRKELGQKLRQLERSLERLADEEELFERERAEILSRKESCLAEKASFEKEVTELKKALEEALAEEVSLRRRWEELRKSGAELEKLFREKSARLSEISGRLKTLRRRQDELEEEKRKLRNRKRNAAQQEALLTEELNFVREMLRREKETRRNLETRRGKLKEELALIEEELARAEEALSELEKEEKTLERERAQLREKLHKLELDRVEAEMTLEHLQREARENQETDLEAFLQDTKPAVKDLSAIEAEMVRIREKLAEFPPVNLAAAEELAKARERQEFLASRRSELLVAIADLEKALRRLDEESRKRLREALAEANRKLAEVFPLLFEGGRAELYFTDSEDPLSAGLDLKVKLPGKPVKHLTMLSGGEKALCALAVLFAFYLVKPGPFCILDEVDAPLDEANTLRFNELLKKLKEYSQVILVTHNPRVMEIADALFGVTMEEKGVSKVVSVKLT